MDIQTTGVWTDPTQVVGSWVRFSGTQASNDGILYEETFNRETEAEFNSTQEEVPVDFTNFMFSSLTNTLASKVSGSTYDVQFDYSTAQSRLDFRIFNRSKALPPAAIQTAGTLTKARSR